METCSVVLTLSLLKQSYGVTSQMKPLMQYFCMVPFVFSIFYKMKFRNFLEFQFLVLSRVKLYSLQR